MKPNEAGIHQALANYIKLQYPDVVFISDQSGVHKASKYGQTRANALNSDKGFPDLFIYAARKGFHGMGLEIKAEGKSPWKKDGTLKAGEHLLNQELMLYRLMLNGYYAVFGVGFDDCKRLIDEYLKGE